MILAILPDTTRTESLLSSLSEADFNLNDVSVVMQDVDMRNKIAQDVGPLQGVAPDHVADALRKAGVNRQDAKQCRDALNSGKVVVAMKVDPKYSPAAVETFKDHSAEIIEE